MPLWVRCVLTALVLYGLGVAFILLGVWQIGSILFVTACFFVLLPFLPERRRK
jgi:hypothetical protein